MQASPLAAPRTEVREFVAGVYRWMTAGLAVTGAVARLMAGRPELVYRLASDPLLFWGLVVAELAAVYVLSGRAARLSPAAATGVFLGYAALNGATLSAVFLVYARTSVAGAFFVTAGAFAAMSVYGSLTERDLTSLGSLAGMALIGLVLASVANLFLGSDVLDWAAAWAGVLVFTALTAYDAQWIKNMAVLSQFEGEPKEPVYGALALYLDFVNLFLSLLRIAGRRRD